MIYSLLPPPEIFDILRNHRYTVNVTSIDGRGYDSEEEALRSKAVNIETEIQVWDESDVPVIDTDGQYYLKVNTDSLHYFREGRAQKLVISTDHPDGWSIEVPAGMEWVDPVSALSGPAEVKAHVDVACKEYTPSNSVETHREGYITIKAGRIRRNIKIYQEKEPELSITVTPHELTFRKGAPNPKSVTVAIYPENSTVYFSQGSIPGIPPIATWHPGYGPASYDNMPLLSPPVYNFRPVPNDTGDMLGATITIYIKDGDGKFVSENVTIRQMATDILFERNPKLTYPGAGGSLNMTVTSDSDWKIASVTPNGAIYNYDNTAQSPGEGVVFPFEMLANPNFYDREIVLEIASDDPEFTPRTETLVQGFINPYIYLTAQEVTSAEINLGNGAVATSQSVYVRSNALWTVATSGSWDIVVGSIDITTGGSVRADQMQTDVVNVSSKAYPAAAGTPAAGEYTAAAGFKSTNHNTPPANANQASGQLTIKRTVPSWFSFTGAAPATVDKTGGNIRVTVETNAPWSVTPTHGDAVSRMAQPWGPDALDILIPPNDSWNERTVTVTYNGTDNNSPVSGTAVSFTQPSHSIGTPYLSSSSIAAGGQDITVTVPGNYNTGYVQVQATGTGLNLSENTDASGEVTLSIPNNSTGGSRNITFQYRRLVNSVWESSWTTISTISQPKGNFVLKSTGRVVALSDLPGMYWAAAMGIDSRYDREYYYNTYGNDITNRNYNPTDNSGCAGYSEPGYPAWTWRLPTVQEVQEMQQNASLLGMNMSNYWTSNESSSLFDQAVSYTFVTGAVKAIDRDKFRSLMPSRCVRDQ